MTKAEEMLIEKAFRYAKVRLKSKGTSLESFLFLICNYNCRYQACLWKVACYCECEDRRESLTLTPTLTTFVKFQILSSIIYRLSVIKVDKPIGLMVADNFFLLASIPNLPPLSRSPSPLFVQPHNPPLP